MPTGHSRTTSQPKRKLSLSIFRATSPPPPPPIITTNLAPIAVHDPNTTNLNIDAEPEQRTCTATLQPLNESTPPPSPLPRTPPAPITPTRAQDSIRLVQGYLTPATSLAGVDREPSLLYEPPFAQQERAIRDLDPPSDLSNDISFAGSTMTVPSPTKLPAHLRQKRSQRQPLKPARRASQLIHASAVRLKSEGREKGRDFSDVLRRVGAEGRKIKGEFRVTSPIAETGQEAESPLGSGSGAAPPTGSVESQMIPDVESEGWEDAVMIKTRSKSRARPGLAALDWAEEEGGVAETHFGVSGGDVFREEESGKVEGDKKKEEGKEQGWLRFASKGKGKEREDIVRSKTPDPFGPSINSTKPKLNASRHARSNSLDALNLLNPNADTGSPVKDNSKGKRHRKIEDDDDICALFGLNRRDTSVQNETNARPLPPALSNIPVYSGSGSFSKSASGSLPLVASSAGGNGDGDGKLQSSASASVSAGRSASRTGKTESATSKASVGAREEKGGGPEEGDSGKGKRAVALKAIKSVKSLSGGLGRVGSWSQMKQSQESLGSSAARHLKKSQLGMSRSQSDVRNVSTTPRTGVPGPSPRRIRSSVPAEAQAPVQKGGEIRPATASLGTKAKVKTNANKGEVKTKRNGASKVKETKEGEVKSKTTGISESKTSKEVMAPVRKETKEGSRSKEKKESKSSSDLAGKKGSRSSLNLRAKLSFREMRKEKENKEGAAVLASTSGSIAGMARLQSSSMQPGEEAEGEPGNISFQRTASNLSADTASNRVSGDSFHSNALDVSSTPKAQAPSQVSSQDKELTKRRSSVFGMKRLASALNLNPSSSRPDLRLPTTIEEVADVTPRGSGSASMGSSSLPFSSSLERRSGRASWASGSASGSGFGMGSGRVSQASRSGSGKVSLGSGSVKWDEEGLEAAMKEARRERFRRAASSLVDITPKRHPYSRSAPDLQANQDGNRKEDGEESDEETVDVFKLIEKDKGNSIEGKRRRPVSDLTGVRTKGVFTKDGFLDMLDETTRDLTTLINRLDLEATPSPRKEPSSFRKREVRKRRASVDGTPMTGEIKSKDSPRILVPSLGDHVNSYAHTSSVTSEHTRPRLFLNTVDLNGSIHRSEKSRPSLPSWSSSTSSRQPRSRLSATENGSPVKVHTTGSSSFSCSSTSSGHPSFISSLSSASSLRPYSQSRGTATLPSSFVDKDKKGKQPWPLSPRSSNSQKSRSEKGDRVGRPSSRLPVLSLSWDERGAFPALKPVQPLRTKKQPTDGVSETTTQFSDLRKSFNTPSRIPVLAVPDAEDVPVIGSRSTRVISRSSISPTFDSSEPRIGTRNLHVSSSSKTTKFSSAKNKKAPELLPPLRLSTTNCVNDLEPVVDSGVNWEPLPSPGLPPGGPLPPPLPTAFNAVVGSDIWQDAGDVYNPPSNHTDKSFDSTGELNKLCQSNKDEDQASFIKQLDSAFRTPPKFDLRKGIGADLKLFEPVPTSSSDAQAEPADGEARQISPSALLPSDKIRFKPSYGQLNRNFKFGSSPAHPSSRARRYSDSSSCSSSRSPLHSSTAVPRSRYQPRTSSHEAYDESCEPSGPDSSSNKRVKRILSDPEICRSQSRRASDTSFPGFDAFENIRPHSEFLPNRPSTSLIQNSGTRSFHPVEQSRLSIATASSLDMASPPKDRSPLVLYGLRNRHMSDDFSHLASSADDTFSFYFHNQQHSRIDSDMSSFYLDIRKQSSLGESHAHNLTSCDVSVSDASANSVAQKYATYGASSGRMAWAKYQQDSTHDSNSDSSGRPSAPPKRPSVGERMFASTVAPAMLSPSHSLSSADGSEDLNSDYCLPLSRMVRHEQNRSFSASDTFLSRLDRRSSFASEQFFATNDRGQFRPASLASSTSSDGSHGTPEEDDTVYTMLGGGHIRRRSMRSVEDNSPCLKLRTKKSTVGQKRLEASAQQEPAIPTLATMPEASCSAQILQGVSPASPISDNDISHDDVKRDLPFPDASSDVASIHDPIEFNTRSDEVPQVAHEMDQLPVSSNGLTGNSNDVDTPMPITRIEEIRAMEKPSPPSPLARHFGNKRMQLASLGLGAFKRISLEESCLIADGADCFNEHIFARPRPSRVVSRSISSGTSNTYSSSSSLNPPALWDEVSLSGDSQTSFEVDDLQYPTGSLSSIASGIGRRRRISGSVRSRAASSMYQTIDEEGRDLGRPATGGDVEWAEWANSEKGMEVLRKCFLLKEQARQTVEESRRNWPDTSYTRFVMKSFKPPARRDGMRSFLEHSKRSYVPLPSPRRRRTGSRVSSKVSPYRSARSESTSPSRDKKMLERISINPTTNDQSESRGGETPEREAENMAREEVGGVMRAFEGFRFNRPKPPKPKLKSKGSDNNLHSPHV